MKRLAVIPLSALLAAGCAHRPPVALAGRWDYSEGQSKRKVTTRLTLEPNGQWRLTRLGVIDSYLGGPLTADGQVIESGDYTADAAAIRLNVRTLYLGGLDRGATMGGNLRLKYALNGGRMTIENKGLPFAPDSTHIADPALCCFGPPDLPLGSPPKTRAQVPATGAPSPLPPWSEGIAVRSRPMVTLVRTETGAPACTGAAEPPC